MFLISRDTSGFVRIRLAVALLLALIAAILVGLSPAVLKHIVDQLAGPTTNTPIGAWVLAYAVMLWLARSTAEVRGFIYARAERRLIRGLMGHVFAHLLRLPLRFHLDRETGAVHQTVSQGLQGCQTLLHTTAFGLLPGVAELATSLVVIAKLATPTYLVLFAAVILFYGIVFGRAARLTLTSARRASAAQVDAMARLSDGLLNYEAIKHFAAEAAVEHKADIAFGRSERAWVRFYRHYATTGLVVASIYAAFVLVTLLLAIRDVRNGRLSIGTFVLINTAMFQLIRPIEQLGYAVQLISQSAGYLEGMVALFGQKAEAPSLSADSTGGPSHTAPPSARDRARGVRPVRHSPSDTILLKPSPPEVEVHDAWVSYAAGRPVLRGVSFRMAAGKTVGLVGQSGSGKSTIVRLLLRLLDPDRGQILLNGVCIKTLASDVLRRAIAVVPQDPVLFNESIADNIAFGRPGSSLEEIQHAAKVAQLHEFINTLPDGYTTPVGERGVQLSGGEKQRVAIARAALKHSRIYVFDEATSSLDSRTEMEIQRSLANLSQNATTLIIAHRLSAVTHADHIAVLEAGTITERGTHSSLLAQGGAYASLWEIQRQGRLTL